MIQIGSEGDSPNSQDSDQNDVAQDTLTHTSFQNNDDPQTGFITQLQNTAISYVAMVAVPKPRLGTCVEKILVDTGTAKRSNAGAIQYDGYCSCIGEIPNIDRSKAAVSIHSHIADSNAHNLLSIHDMDRLGIYLIIYEDQVEHPSSGMRSKIVRTLNHSFLIYNPYTFCTLIPVDLQRINRHFIHPPTEKLMELLKREEIARLILAITPDTLKHFREDQTLL